MKRHRHKTIEPQNLNNPVVAESPIPPKMGIHFLSNALWAPSGYGVQAGLFIPRIQKLGYPVSMTAFYGLQGHTINLGETLIFPGGFEPYGNDVAANNTNMANADVLITNMDAWVCNPQAFANTRWVPWFPNDSHPLPEAIKSRVRVAFDRIVYAKSTLKECEEEGIKCHYVPMGVDTKLYKPIDKAQAWKEVNEHIPAPLDPDKYTVAMVAMNKGNPSRKAFVENIHAFAELHKKHPDTQMYIHTLRCENGEMQGVNLTEVVRSFGVEKSVFFPHAQVMINGYPAEFVNSVYNIADVLTACTMGEGFGLPIIEAQAAGCPVIVGDWTSMPELLFSGWKVAREDAVPIYTFLGAYQFLPRWQAIADRMEEAYTTGKTEELHQKAILGAAQFDADLVTEKYWKPTLEIINQKVQDDKAAKAAPKVATVKENDCLLIQHTTLDGDYPEQIAVTSRRNIEYCHKHGIDYQTTLARIGGYSPERHEAGWGKVKLIQQALQVERYKYIVYLDADVIIADLDRDLREACIPGKVGAVWHDLKQGGQVLGHHNVGVLTFCNTPEVRKFVDDWLAGFPGTTEFPWFEQGVFNKLGNDTGMVATLGPEWNSVAFVNPVQKPVILGFHGYPERVKVMQEALAQLEGAT